eukprot:SAG22_NODE_155_length_17123_cov_37.528489_2_plen_146_part_00
MVYAMTQARMLEANAMSEDNKQNHAAVTAKSKTLARELRESNDRCADLKHEVGYLLSQLAEAKAGVGAPAEMPPEGPSKPVRGARSCRPPQYYRDISTVCLSCLPWWLLQIWEAASVTLPTEDARVPGADSIVRMRVIEWGTVGW